MKISKIITVRGDMFSLEYFRSFLLNSNNIKGVKNGK